jgi:hypothetical protein
MDFVKKLDQYSGTPQYENAIKQGLKPTEKVIKAYKIQPDKTVDTKDYQLVSFKQIKPAKNARSGYEQMINQGIHKQPATLTSFGGGARI